MNLKLAAAVILFVCFFYGLDDAWGSSDTSSSSSSSDSSSVSLVCDNKHTYFKKKQSCLMKCDVAYGCYSCKRVYDCPGCKWKCVVHCSDLCPPLNGDVNMTGNNVGDQASYSCDPHYQLIGQYNRTCLDNGSWSEEEPSCAATGCSVPLALMNGDIDIDGEMVGHLYVINSAANYVCDADFKLSDNGATPRICQYTGSSYDWSDTAPTCNPIVHCPHLCPLEKGYTEASGTNVGDEAIYYCLGYYTLDIMTSIGNYIRQCQENGSWSGIHPSCNPYGCYPPPELQNGDIIFDGEMVEHLHAPHSKAMYKCDRGFELYPNDYNPYKQCTVDYDEGDQFIWMGEIFTCNPVSCGEPSQPLNGNVEYDDGYRYENYAKYTCDEGYVLNGNPYQTCLSTGSWSSLPPVCDPVGMMG